MLGKTLEILGSSAITNDLGGGAVVSRGNVGSFVVSKQNVGAEIVARQNLLGGWALAFPSGFRDGARRS